MITNNQNLFFKNLPIFYINLDSSESRNKFITESFKKNGIDLYFRVSAVDGNTLQKSIYEDHGLSAPEAGLFLSFKRAVEMFLETDYEYAAIAEDDVDLDNSQKIKFNFYETLQYHDPEYYVLQCAPAIQNESSASLKIKKRVPSEKEMFWGTAMMIINRSFAEKILKEVFYDDDIHPCGPSDWQQQLDYCIYSHAETYVSTLFTVENFKSTISVGTEHVIKNAIKNIKSITEYREIFLQDLFYDTTH